MERTIQIGGATIIIDSGADTLRPRSHEDGMILGVGFSANDAAGQERQKALRDEAWDAATDAIGAEPESGWRWLDHNGHEVFPG